MFIWEPQNLVINFRSYVCLGKRYRDWLKKDSIKCPCKWGSLALSKVFRNFVVDQLPVGKFLCSGISKKKKKNLSIRGPQWYGDLETSLLWETRPTPHVVTHKWEEYHNLRSASLKSEESDPQPGDPHWEEEPHNIWFWNTAGLEV